MVCPLQQVGQCLAGGIIRQAVGQLQDVLLVILLFIAKRNVRINSMLSALHNEHTQPEVYHINPYNHLGVDPARLSQLYQHPSARASMTLLQSWVHTYPALCGHVA